MRVNLSVFITTITTKLQDTRYSWAADSYRICRNVGAFKEPAVHQHRWTFPWSSQINSKTSRHSVLRSILILYSNRFRSVKFSIVLRFSSQILYVSIMFYARPCYKSHTHFRLFFLNLKPETKGRHIDRNRPKGLNLAVDDVNEQLLTSSLCNICFQFFVTLSLLRPWMSFSAYITSLICYPVTRQSTVPHPCNLYSGSLRFEARPRHRQSYFILFFTPSSQN